MATSSFFHSVVINTPEQAEKLVDALEKAEKASKERTEPEMNCREIRGEELKEVWDNIVFE